MSDKASMRVKTWLIMSTMTSGNVDNINRKSVHDSEEVFDLIHTIMHLFRSQQYRGLPDGSHHLTHMEGKLLGFFARYPGATLSDLVAHSARDKGQLARLIKSLKEEDLLSVQKDQKTDRRSVGLELTGAGHAVHRTLHRQSERLAMLAVKDLDSEKRRQLLVLLRQVRSNLENL
jgi:DNA-binding MarR family transcriptional regulator